MKKVYYSEFFPSENSEGVEGTTLPTLSRSRMEVILDSIEGLVDDSMLSRDEKLRILIPLVDELTANYNSVISLAGEFELDTDDVTTKYEELFVYLESLEPAWDDTTEATEVDREEFRTFINNLVTEIYNLDNLITLALRSYVDDVIDRIDDIASDAILSTNEKSDVIKEYAVLIGEQSTLQSQATALSITTELTTYNTAVSAVTTYLNSLSPTWNNVTLNTPINAVTFRNVFVNAYLAKTALQTKIDNRLKFNIDEANGRINDITSDSILSANEKPEIVRLYDNIVATVAALRPQAITLGVSVSAYDTAISNMNTYLGGLSPNWADATSNTPIVAATFRAIFNAVFTAQEAVKVAVSAKLKSDIDIALGKIADISSDNILSAGEKSEIIMQYNALNGEYSGLSVQANSLGITTENTTYSSALTALNTYLGTLSPAWNNVSADSVIVGSTFRTYFTNVYTARTALQVAINNKLKTDIDLALNKIANISSDNILSAGEKSEIILQHTILNGEYTGLNGQASSLGITTENTAYSTALSDLNTYLTSLSPAWNNVSVDTPITGSAFRSYFTNVYTARTALQVAINAKLKGDIDLALSKITDISSDNILSSNEKPEVIRLYDTIIAKYNALRAQALTFGISTTAYDTVISALNGYLNTLSPSWLNTSVNTPIIGTTFRQYFNDVFLQQEAMQVAITDKLKGDIVIINGKLADIASDNILSAGEKPEVLRTYQTIEAFYYTVRPQALTLGISTSSYDSAITALNNYLNALSPSWLSFTTDTVIVGNTFRQKFSDVLTQQNALQVAINAKLKSDIDIAVGRINDISSDNVLSASEKPEVIRLYDTINAKAAALRPQAVTLGISVSAYDTAIGNMNTYLGGLSPSWADTTSNTTIVAATFRAIFSAVFTAQEAVQVAVTNKLKSDIDIALGEITNISSDNVLSKGEKFEVVRKWQELATNYNTLSANASSYGISITAYSTAMSNLNNYLNSLSPPWGDYSNNTPIVGTTFRSYFENLIIAQIAIEVAINDYINGRVTTALNKLSDISSDGILSPSEKYEVIRQHNLLNTQFGDLNSKSIALGITTELYAHYNSLAGGGGYTGVNAYLNSLTTPVAWNDVSGNTTVSGTTLRQVFNDAYTTQTALMTKMSSLDPATRINTGTTTINGGMLTNNSLNSHKLTINDRNITVIGCDFKYEAGLLSWTAGYVLYYNNSGALAAATISAGSSYWAGGGYNYIYWPQGANAFYIGVDNWNTIMADDNVIMCTWYANTSSFVANYGGTIVSGDRIVTGTITANKMNVSQLSAITANIGEITAGLLRSADYLNFIDLTNGRSQFARSGYAFRSGNLGTGVIMWFGLNSVSIGSETRTNGVWAFGTDGKVYYGTAELGGGTELTVTLNNYAPTGGGYGAGYYYTSPTVTVSVSGNTGTPTIRWLKTVDGPANDIFAYQTGSNVYFGGTVSAGGLSRAIYQCVVTDGAKQKIVIVDVQLSDYT